MATPTPFQGTERFEVRRCLGAGGFGTVYEALDRKRGALVAIKVLRQADAGQIYRFKQEFRALRDIAHPNLITLYELVSDGDPWLFSMELIEGVDFLRFLNEQVATDTSFTLPTPESRGTPRPPTQAGESTQTVPDLQRPSAEFPEDIPAPESFIPVPLDRLVDALSQLTQGLLALHHAGKIHRDIKPANVLCTRAGRVVILDFGIAQDLGPEQGDITHDLAGTPVYMAPEQALEQPLTPAADWYSVGVLLYRALTGRLPFEGSAYQVLRRKLSEEPRPPSALRGGIPEALDQLCFRLLSRDPEARPGGEEILGILANLTEKRPHESLLTRSFFPSRESVFVGREPHLALLWDAYTESQRDKTVVVLCRGPSGAGKSTICRYFLEQLGQQEPRLLVLSGRCFEHEEVPFKALDGVVDDLLRYLRLLGPETADALLPPGIHALTRIFPVLLRAPAIEARQERGLPESNRPRTAAFAALRELLSRVTRRQRLVLFIDDLQWGDLDSISLLFDLLRPPAPPPLLLLLGYRSDEEATSAPLLSLRQGLLKELEQGVLIRELEVGDLTVEEARTLARQLLPKAEQDRADAIASEAGRNALFVTELSRSPDLHGGQTLDDALRMRFERLDLPSKRLLSVVAVAGQPVPRSIAASAVFLEEERAEEPRALATLRAGRLIRVRQTHGYRRQEEHREELLVYHDRIRQTILQALPPGGEPPLHIALAQAFLTSDSAEPERLAFHLLRGGQAQEAARHAIRASELAEQALAYHQTARLCRVALETNALTEPEIRTIQARLASALAGTGRPKESAEIYLGLAKSDPANQLRWWRQAASQFFVGGYTREGMEVVGKLATIARLWLPGSETGLLAAGLGYRTLLALRGFEFQPRAEEEIPREELLRIDTCEIISHATSEANLALCFALAGLWYALRAGEPRRVAHALAASLPVLFVLGVNRKQLDRLAERSRELAAQHGDDFARGKIAYAQGHMEHLEGRWRASSGLLQEARQIVENGAFEAASRLSFIQTLQVYNLRWMGDFKKLAAEVPELLKEAEEQGHRRQATVVPCTAGFLLPLREDDPARAKRSLLPLLNETQGSQRSVVLFFATDALLRTLLYQGDLREAQRIVEQQRPELRGSGILRLEFFRLVWCELEALVAITSGHTSTVERQIRALERARPRFGPPLGALLRALIARRQGNLREAQRKVEQAEAGFRVWDMKLHEASAMLRRGQWLGGAEGERLKQEALAWFQHQGVRVPERMARLILPLE